MVSLSLLSFILPVAECLHMSISITVVTVKTNTLATSSRRNNRRRGQWHKSSRMSRQRVSSQDSSILQKASIMKMSLLITYFSESIHQGDIGVMSKQLGTKRLKLIMKSSQKVIGQMKLKCGRLIFAGLTGGRRQLGAKSIKLTPNIRKPIKEVINCSVTLSKKLLLTNSSKIGRLSNRLIFLMKKISHLMSPLKLHNISSKTILYTSC
jgi:hypothetical protein